MPKDNPLEKPSPYRVQVLERTFQILDVLAEDGMGVTLQQIAAAVGLHKSTAHRLMMALESARFVERNGSESKYRIGSRMMEIGLTAVSRLNVYEIAPPHLHALMEETGESVHLAVLRDGEMVSLINVESRQNVRTPSAAGARTPAHCTAHGKAILAFSPPAQVENFLARAALKEYTAKTITSAVRLRAELRTVRDRGYAIDSEEWETGLRCIGAPVMDSAGIVIAAISISGPLFRITTARVPSLAEAVLRGAARVSASLGYRPAGKKLTARPA